MSGTLLHVAWWDQRVIVLFEQWRSGGIEPRPELAEDVAWMNDTTKPMLLAMPPRTAALLAVAIAQEVDAMVAALPDDLIARNAALGDAGLNLSRADHRGEHLDEIERSLSG